MKVQAAVQTLNWKRYVFTPELHLKDRRPSNDKFSTDFPSCLAATWEIGGNFVVGWSPVFQVQFRSEGVAFPVQSLDHGLDFHLFCCLCPAVDSNFVPSVFCSKRAV